MAKKVNKKSVAGNTATDLIERMNLKAVTNLTGKYLLPWDIGQEFSIDAKRGQELVDNGDAVIVK